VIQQVGSLVTSQQLTLKVQHIRNYYTILYHTFLLNEVSCWMARRCHSTKHLTIRAYSGAEIHLVPHILELQHLQLSCQLHSPSSKQPEWPEKTHIHNLHGEAKIAPLVGEKWCNSWLHRYGTNGQCVTTCSTNSSAVGYVSCMGNNALSKLTAVWSQGMLGVILCRIFCLPVCYPKI
jgi:hypothetical protein